MLVHPNIVRTHGVIDAEACGLSMEYLEGRPLTHVLERIGRRAFPLDLHLRILCEVLGALEYALDHDLSRWATGSAPAQCVHRDVTPTNVLVTSDGEVKLLGMGSARATMARERELGRALTDVRYAAPELLRMYSIGCSWNSLPTRWLATWWGC